MPPVIDVCATYVAAIRHINKVDLPSIKAKIAMYETLLASLEAQGLPDSALESVQTALDQANQDLVDTNISLEAFTSSYQMFCGDARTDPSA